MYHNIMDDDIIKQKILEESCRCNNITTVKHLLSQNVIPSKKATTYLFEHIKDKWINHQRGFIETIDKIYMENNMNFREIYTETTNMCTKTRRQDYINDTNNFVIYKFRTNKITNEEYVTVLGEYLKRIVGKKHKHKTEKVRKYLRSKPVYKIYEYEYIIVDDELSILLDMSVNTCVFRDRKAINIMTKRIITLNR